MKKGILTEIGRVREIMGLVVEQTTSTTEIKMEDGKMVEVTSEVLEPYQSGKWEAKFAPGKYSGVDIKGNIDGDIAKLAAYLVNPLLTEKKIIVSVSAGSSKTPITPGGNTAKALTNAGVTPDNAGLAKLRGRTAIELVKNGLRGKISDESFNNIEFVVDLSKIEAGDPFVAGDVATDERFTKHQFLSATAFAQATIVTRADLPTLCDKPTLSGKGGKGKPSSLGPTKLPYAVYSENEGKGKEYDLGMGTEGIMTFNFTAYRIPDMFQITYGTETYTSSGPGGLEGFVSNNFDDFTEGSRGYNRMMSKIEYLEKLEGRNKGKETKQTERQYKIPNSLKRVLGEMGIPLGDSGGKTGSYINRDWILNFYEKYQPGSRSRLGKLTSNKRKMKPNEVFVNDNRITGGSKIGLAAWETINDIWMKTDEKYSDVVDRNEKLTRNSQTNRGGTSSELRAQLEKFQETGSMTDYADMMTTELLDLGFKQGVIGMNGSITFDKVPNVDKMYLQVYAPLDGTAWGATLSCKSNSMAT